LEVWYNPSCSKCRSAKAALDEAGVEYVERRYLDLPPTEAELAAVVKRLNVNPWDIARSKEVKDAGIDLPKDSEHVGEWIRAMIANPKTIQRPIIIGDGICAVARDAETLQSITHAANSRRV
jgi:arsenate reductase